MSSESKVEVSWIGGYLFVGSDEKGHTVTFDSSDADPSRGFGPMNTLLASLGACSGMDIVAILGKRKQKFTSLKVEVAGKRPQYGFPKPFTEVHLRYVIAGKGLEKRHVEEAVVDSVKKYCSVAATISGKAQIGYAYEILEL